MKKMYSNYYFLIEDNEIWFVNYMYSILCNYSLSEKKIKEIVPLDNEDKAEFAYSSIQKNNNIIAIVPANASRIVLYDVIDKKLDYKAIKCDKTIYNKYMSSICDDGVLYAFPGNCNNIITMKIDEGIYSQHEIKGNVAVESVCQYQNILRKRGDNIYLLSATKNELHVFNIKDLTEKIIIELPKENVRLSVFEFIDEQRLLLLKEDGNACIYNLVTKQIVNIINDVEGFVHHRYDANRATFTDIRVHENVAYVFPGQANMILKIDINQLSMERVNVEFNDISVKGELTSLVYDYRDNTLLFFRLDTFQLCEFDLNNGSVSLMNIEVDDNEDMIKNAAKKIIGNNSLIIESEIFKLNGFLKGI